MPIGKERALARKVIHHALPMGGPSCGQAEHLLSYTPFRLSTRLTEVTCRRCLRRLAVKSEARS